MTLNSKLSGARAILEAHNSHLVAGFKAAETQIEPKGFVLIDKFFENLEALGGSTEEALSEATWEDLEKCGAPRILARKIATLFRGEQTISGPVVPQRVIIEDNDPEKKAKAMTFVELLRAYDPKNHKSPIGDRLKKISGGRKFLVFNGDTINVEVSLNLLEELDDFGEKDEIEIDGNILPTYAIGNRPGRFTYQHPLYPDKLLRTNDPWYKLLDGTPTQKRIVLTLHLAAIRTHELWVDKMNEAEILELAASDNALIRVNRRYVKAALMYQELAEVNAEPNLRVALQGSDKPPQKQNPFNLGKNHTT
jgi:hypothetical protein